MELQGKRILLGITGGVAAYKAASLLRLLTGAGAAAGRLDLRQIVPGDVGALFEHRSRQGFLDGQADVGVGILVQAAHTTVGRQTGIGREAGSGNEKDALCGRKQATRGGNAGGAGQNPIRVVSDEIGRAHV